MKKILVFVLMLFALASCAETAETEVFMNPTIIDVRTPAEFNSGHVAGAINIDLQDPTFEAQISDLDKDGEYVVYCRSGNRSAQAMSIMESHGYKVQNLGSVADAAQALGLEIVKP